jgi:hypothetical protein
MDNPVHLPVQSACAIQDAREQSLQTMGEFLNAIEVHRSRRALQAVRAAEDFLQFGPCRSGPGFPDNRKQRPDLLQVITVLHLKHREQLLLNVLQSVPLDSLHPITGYRLLQLLRQCGEVERRFFKLLGAGRGLLARLPDVSHRLGDLTETDLLLV